MLDPTKNCAAVTNWDKQLPYIHACTENLPPVSLLLAFSLVGSLLHRSHAA